MLEYRHTMAQSNANVVSASSTGPRLPDGVVDLNSLESSDPVSGCRVFTHYNGSTDELSGLVAGMCVLDPGSSPHPPHQHPEEEFMIVASGTGEIECAGTTTQVGPGAMMYCAGNTVHGITNTGKVPLTFYWSKWLGRSAGL
jgi:mannose-6-phosphate isomerase-like protein (cupin superfamily)